MALAGGAAWRYAGSDDCPAVNRIQGQRSALTVQSQYRIAAARFRAGVAHEAGISGHQDVGRIEFSAGQPWSRRLTTSAAV